MTNLKYLPLVESIPSQQDLGLISTFDSEAAWIWTTERPYPRGIPDAPGEQRGFRKTFVNTVVGKIPRNLTIVIAVDNYYALYVNGALLHAPNPEQDWAEPLLFAVPVEGDKNVIAIRAINKPGDLDGLSSPAGLRAVAAVGYTDGTSTVAYTGGDQTWLGDKYIDEGWEQPDFNDGAWAAALVLPKSVNTNPWGGLKSARRVFTASSLPSKVSANGTIITTGEARRSSGTGIEFSPGELAGLIIGLTAFVTAAVGMVTYWFMRKKVAAARRGVKEVPSPDYYTSTLQTTPFTLPSSPQYNH